MLLYNYLRYFHFWKEWNIYSITRTSKICGSYKLNSLESSRGENYSDYDYLVEIVCNASELDENGMVIEFELLEKNVYGALNDKCLNDVFDVNPTAENLAKWVHDTVCNLFENSRGYCKKVTVYGSAGTEACYIHEDPVSGYDPYSHSLVANEAPNFKLDLNQCLAILVPQSK